ncbi:hypothetical protein EDB83DRAFT_2228109, partial [Lactarius deliciosus]
WDRSGVIYTEPFKWTDEMFLDFLWQFNYLSAADCGYDTTICPASTDEAVAALLVLQKHTDFRDVKAENLHKILVWDDWPWMELGTT